MNHIYKTDDWKLRDSIYKAFNGKCFYTSQKVRKEDMVIDHILPKSKGGEDSVYNYVLTSKEVNSKKGAKLNLDGIEPVLYLVKTIYAPKVLRCIKKIIDRADRDALKVEGKASAGMRKTIYFRDDGSFEAIKGAAEKEGISVSKYIVRKCLGSGVVSKTLIKDSGQLDRIEGRLDELLKGLSKPSRSDKIESHKPSKADLSVEEIVASGKDWSGGFSKEQQVGKKVKK